MPSPQAILAGLAIAARGAIAVAIAWHVVAFAAAAALLGGWRPSRRTVSWLLTAPVASASLVAFSFHNPFNGILLGALALALATIAGRLDAADVRPSSREAAKARPRQARTSTSASPWTSRRCCCCSGFSSPTSC